VAQGEHLAERPDLRVQAQVAHGGAEHPECGEVHRAAELPRPPTEVSEPEPDDAGVSEREQLGGARASVHHGDPAEAVGMRGQGPHRIARLSLP
jgi:hypothetical protein